MNSSILWASSPTSESVCLLLVLAFCRNGEEGRRSREGCRGEMLQEQLVTIFMKTAKSSVFFCSPFPFLWKVNGMQGIWHCRRSCWELSSYPLGQFKSFLLFTAPFWSTNASSKIYMKNRSWSVHLQTGKTTGGRGNGKKDWHIF